MRTLAEETELANQFAAQICDWAIEQEIPPSAALAALSAALVHVAKAAEIAPQIVLRNVAQTLATAMGAQLVFVDGSDEKVGKA